MTTRKCLICENPVCEGQEKLREFESWSDLVSHCGEITIVRAVNDHARRMEGARFTRQKYYAKRNALVKVAREILGKDEVEAIERVAAERASEIVEGGLEG